MSEVIYQKKTGENILLNENPIKDYHAKYPFHINFSNGIRIEGGWFAYISNGFTHVFDNFVGAVSCPFSCYTDINESLPGVSLHWDVSDPHHIKATVVTSYTGVFSIEYIAIGKWKE